MWEPGPKPEIDPKHDVRHRVVGCAEFPKRAWLEREGGRGGIGPKPFSQPLFARKMYVTAQSQGAGL